MTGTKTILNIVSKKPTEIPAAFEMPSGSEVDFYVLEVLIGICIGEIRELAPTYLAVFSSL